MQPVGRKDEGWRLILAAAMRMRGGKLPAPPPDLPEDRRAVLDVIARRRRAMEEKIARGRRYLLGAAREAGYQSIGEAVEKDLGTSL